MTPANYVLVLNGLKEKIRQARIHAILSVNTQLLNTYWEIGTAIIKQQREEKWGSKIIDRLAADLRLEFPDMQGLSIRNFKYMKAFAKAYPYYPNVQAELAQIDDDIKLPRRSEIMQAPLAQLSWYHHITLINKVKDLPIRLFYINKVIENGWSRNVMIHQIETGLHIRQGALVTNFKTTVPDPQSDLIQQIFKDPYNFDFLQLGEKAKERDLENALTHYITKFLLELGDGFAFKGRQYRLESDGQEYFLDLLFYHTRLRRHIIIELKVGDFLPEFVGKMNFYLGLLDNTLKVEYDEPSIGLILCKTKSKIIAEYALRDTSKPIGIAEYKLAEILPDDIKGELPSIAELEQKLDEELKGNLRPAEARLKTIKEKIKAVHNDEIRISVTTSILNKLYIEALKPLYKQIIKELSDLNELFKGWVYSWSAQSKPIENFKQLNKFFDDGIRINIFSELTFYYFFAGLKKGGLRDLNESILLKIIIHHHWYGVELTDYNDDMPFIKRLYHQTLTTADRQFIVNTTVNQMLDKVELLIKKMED